MPYHDCTCRMWLQRQTRAQLKHGLLCELAVWHTTQHVLTSRLWPRAVLRISTQDIVLRLASGLERPCDLQDGHEKCNGSPRTASSRHAVCIAQVCTILTGCTITLQIYLVINIVNVRACLAEVSELLATFLHEVHQVHCTGHRACRSDAQTSAARASAPQCN